SHHHRRSRWCFRTRPDRCAPPLVKRRTRGAYRHSQNAHGRFHSETRSLTLGYATDDIATLRKAMQSLARYPAELGPIRLVGVVFSGLESELQDVLFPELDQAVISTETTFEEDTTATKRTWHATQDVFHPDYGHGWIQGTGHGFVSVRFETRATGPGPFKSFAADDEKLQPADPVDSLAWDLEELGELE